MTASNHYRRVRSLIAKTVASGCTPHEHVSATNLAIGIVKKHGLDPARLAWPEPPKGWRWSGISGQSEVVEAKAKRARKPKSPAGPKPPRVTVGERLIAMLQRADGASLDEIVAEFGILAHSARAIISIEARRKRGLIVALDTESRRYKIVRPGAAA